MLLMVGVSLVEMMALHLAGWRLFKARTTWFCVLYIAQHRAESDGYCIGFLIAALGEIGIEERIRAGPWVPRPGQHDLGSETSSQRVELGQIRCSQAQWLRCDSAVGGRRQETAMSLGIVWGTV